MQIFLGNTWWRGEGHIQGKKAVKLHKMCATSASFLLCVSHVLKITRVYLILLI